MTENFWAQEADKLKEAGDFENKPVFNSEVLKEQKKNIETYKVEFLGEGNDLETEYQGETQEKRAIDIKYQDTEYVWFVNKSKTKDSLYGQIVELAMNNDKKLTGAKAKVTVAGRGKMRRYQLEPVK